MAASTEGDDVGGSVVGSVPIPVVALGGRDDLALGAGGECEPPPGLLVSALAPDQGALAPWAAGEGVEHQWLCPPSNHFQQTGPIPLSTLSAAFRCRPQRAQMPNRRVNALACSRVIRTPSRSTWGSRPGAYSYSPCSRVSASVRRSPEMTIHFLA